MVIKMLVVMGSQGGGGEQGIAMRVEGIARAAFEILPHLAGRDVHHSHFPGP